MQGIRLILMVVLHVYAMLSYDYIVFMSIVTSLMKSKQTNTSNFQHNKKSNKILILLFFLIGIAVEME